MKILLVLIIMVFPAVSNHDACAQQKAASPAPSDSVETADDLASFSRTQPVYDPEGKRDPFGSLVPKEEEEGKKIKGLLNYEKAQLKGIVKTESDTYALVMDADNFGHVLREGYMVYGGYVTAITEDSVYLHIVKYGRALSIILRLETSKSTIVTEEAGEIVVKKPGINVT